MAARLLLMSDGGPGSGNHGHKGRPGQRGGSGPGGGSASEPAKSFHSMSDSEYDSWHQKESTSRIIADDFEKKYGVSLDDANMGRNDRWVEEENQWLSDIAHQTSDDLDQVGPGFGKCGYIQSSDGSKAINAYLRREEVGRLYTKGQMKETIDAMNRLIDKSSLSQDMAVDRCAGINALEAMGIPVGAHGKTFRIGHAFCTDGLDYDAVAKAINDGYVGSVITDKGFMSASAVPSRNVFGGSDVTFSIHAPKGTKAFISDNTMEAELVFKPNTKQRITGARVIEREATDHDGKKVKRKSIEVSLEIVE